LLIECAKTIIFILMAEQEWCISTKLSSGNGFSQSAETFYRPAFQREE